MEINGKKISKTIEAVLKKEVKKISKKEKLKLVVFLVGSSPDQLSFVKIKAKTASRLGIKFEFIHFKETPMFEEFMHKIKIKSLDKTVTGIIIQQPLPAQLSTESIYEYIDTAKEIEGHKRKTPFYPPIGLAVLTILKHVFSANREITKNLLIDWSKDRRFFKYALRNKKIVLVGRGLTGGGPIGKTLSEARINYIGINSTTPEPESYYREADVIITAVGNKVLLPQFLKPGVILINVGVRKEKGSLKGDYDAKEVKNIAGYYTPTPGGIGPIDVLYLYKNLLDGAKLKR